MKLYITKPVSIHEEAKQKAKEKEKARERAFRWLVAQKESDKTFQSFYLMHRQRAIDNYNKPTGEVPEE